MTRALAVVLLTGCGELTQLLPREADAGRWHVPGTYREARSTEGHRAHLALTGAEQLSCRDCHLIVDAGFTRRVVRPCVECHPASAEHHHPFDGGVPLTCLTCHAFRPAEGQAGGDRWGCRGCHVAPQEGAPQVAVHVKRCEACHRPHGDPFTRAADCGRCHEVTASHGRGEKALAADTCMTCHPHHTEARVATEQCERCHLSAEVPLRARVKAGALFAKGHRGCSSCHATHRFTAVEVKSCSDCHERTPVLAQEGHTACLTCHRPHDHRSAPRACEGCHQKLSVKHPPDARGHTCTGCHPPHGEAVRAQLAVPCVACHREAPFTNAVVHAAKVECRSCHVDPHAGAPQGEGLCAGCHERQASLARKNEGHHRCAKCHASLPHGPPEAPKGCPACHDDVTPPQAGHRAKLECQSCHQSHSAAVVKACSDCHGGPERPLPGLHQVVKHRQCGSCHAPHLPEPGFRPDSCRPCHAQLSAKSHPAPPRQCVTCHLFGR